MRSLSALGLCLLASLAIAQDTTVINTLTFDSITTRRGWWEFPAAGGQFRKVVMVHTLKCDPQTTWDGFDCGEWDYLTYHFVHEHTGVLDSASLTHPHFLVGTAAPASAFVRDFTGYDLRQRWQRMASVAQVTNETLAQVGTSDTVDADGFMGFGRSQYLYTASELTAAGLVAGPIHELRFHPIGEEAWNFRCVLRMKNSQDAALTAFDDADLSTVFDRVIPPQSGLHLVLDQAFVWDGTSNLLLDVATDREDDAFPGTEEAVTAVAGTALRELGTDIALETNNDFIGLEAAPLASLSDVVTITFRTFGAPELPQNNCFLEAVGANGQRILNIHLPWSDGHVYWDAGSDGSAYDRIDKAAVAQEYKGRWNNWAFVKNTGTGSMKIYLNGVLWHSAGGKTKPLSGITRIRLASDVNGGNPYPGLIDDVNIFNAEVSAATIAAWHDREVNAQHPDYASLLYSFEMEGTLFQADAALTNEVDPGHPGWMMGTVRPVVGRATALRHNATDPGLRPVITLIQGDHVIALDSLLTTFASAEPQPFLTREIFAVQGNTSVPVDTVFGHTGGWVHTYGPDSVLVDSIDNGGTLFLNDTLHYFGVPYEVINDHEIGRYITPYGIQLDLGPNGFSWVYDVTDYQYLLHDSVELSAGNTQELIDLKFLMIGGTPPRPVVNVQRPWGPMRSYSYGSLSDDTELSTVTVPLDPQASDWMLQARLTGHGDATSTQGVQGCCEFKDNTHTLYANGAAVDAWHIWRTEDCANNPVYPQGGSWIYAREGWCPGDVVRDRTTELTPYVSGDSLTLDYGITPVPLNNPGMAGGNYVVNMELFEFGAATHALDAEIYDVLRPSDSGLRSRENPICYDPVLVLRNAGSTALASVTFSYRVSGGQPMEFTWNGNLPHMQRTDVTLPVGSPQFWSGDADQHFLIDIVGVNGGGTDGYADNDHYRTHFNLPVIYPDNFVLYYKTNNRPEENDLYVRDINGQVVFSRTTFTANTTYRDTLQLPPGCYDLEFTDAGNDGLYNYFDQDAGTGTFRFRSLGGTTLRNFNPDFGHRIHAAFGIGTITGLNEAEHEVAFSAQPNPSDGRFTLSVEGITGEAQLDVMDATGRLVRSSALGSIDRRNIPLDLTGEADGVYLVRLVHAGGTSLLRLAKR